MNLKEWIYNFINVEWQVTDILTEDDLRCKLFNFLEKSKINIWNYSLHSEIRWYWDNRNEWGKKLKYRSDMVYINNEWLNSNPTDGIILPSKWYSFNSYKAIIEIKFRRTNWESDNVFLNKIKEDKNKMVIIKDKTTIDSNNKKEYYLIVFDKKYDIISKIENLDIPSYIKIFYKKL